MAIATPAIVAAFWGCGHASRVGDVSLRVEVPGSILLERVNYDIKSGGAGEIGGTIASAQPAGSFSRLVSHVPAGKGYVVEIDAQSSDGTITCTGMATFDVKANETTPVEVHLTCQDLSDGHINIVVGIECPGFAITSYSVSPLSASVGGEIDVSAETSDVDAGVVSFQWTSPTGIFEDPSAEDTHYKCTAPGEIGLEGMALWGPCVDSKTVTVTCFGAD